MKKVLLCVALLLNGCYGKNDSKKNDVKSEKKGINMQREKADKIELKMGGSFKEFHAQYPGVKPKKIVVGSSAPVYYYKKRWSSKTPATILFHYDENKTLELPNTINIFLPEDSIFTSKGIKEFQLQTGITQADLMPYEEARVKFYAFLQRLLKEGWERALVYDDPRISGRHAMHYKLTEDDMYYQDPAYEPTLEEWKKLETGGMSSSNYWVLHYKNKIFLEINLGVVPHKTDDTLASYLMFITIRDGEEEAMGYIAPKNRLKWKEFWAKRLEKASNNRKKTETKLQAKGYTMDESYEDYVIDPKEW